MATRNSSTLQHSAAWQQKIAIAYYYPNMKDTIQSQCKNYDHPGVRIKEDGPYLDTRLGKMCGRIIQKVLNLCCMLN
jgi:hypothetical protein